MPGPGNGYHPAGTPQRPQTAAPSEQLRHLAQVPQTQSSSTRIRERLASDKMEVEASPREPRRSENGGGYGPAGLQKPATQGENAPAAEAWAEYDNTTKAVSAAERLGKLKLRFTSGAGPEAAAAPGAEPAVPGIEPKLGPERAKAMLRMSSASEREFDGFKLGAAAGEVAEQRIAAWPSFANPAGAAAVPGGERAYMNPAAHHASMGPLPSWQQAPDGGGYQWPRFEESARVYGIPALAAGSSEDGQQVVLIYMRLGFA